jgi:hypothetical protein
LLQQARRKAAPQLGFGCKLLLNMFAWALPFPLFCWWCRHVGVAQSLLLVGSSALLLTEAARLQLCGLGFVFAQ